MNATESLKGCRQDRARRWRWAAVVLCAVGVLIGAPGRAGATVSYEFKHNQWAARASFERVGANLVVTLANTSAYDVTDPTEVLCAVFFDLAGDPMLTRVSALLVPGSSVLPAGDPPGGWSGDWPTTNVGGEWAYNAGLTGLPGGATQGISSSGYDLFASDYLFPPQIDLDGPACPNGLNYGITSPGDDPATGNAAVIGSVPLIQHAVQFTLTDLPVGFDPETDVSNVWFQYGTSLTEPTYQGVPEPMTVTGVLLAVGGIAFYVRRRPAA